MRDFATGTNSTVKNSKPKYAYANTGTQMSSHTHALAVAAGTHPNRVPAHRTNYDNMSKFCVHDGDPHDHILYWFSGRLVFRIECRKYCRATCHCGDFIRQELLYNVKSEQRVSGSTTASFMTQRNSKQFYSFNTRRAQVTVNYCV